MLHSGSKLILYVCLLLICQVTVFAQRRHIQPKGDKSDGLIIVESGGNVVFTVNSLKKYNEGVSLNEWTRIALSVSDIDPSDTWRLDVRPFTNKLIGDSYGKELDLEYISISAIETTPDLLPPLTIYNITELTAVTQTLLEGQGNGLFVILLTYEVGTDPSNNLLGEYFDYYFVDLELHFVSN